MQRGKGVLFTYLIVVVGLIIYRTISLSLELRRVNSNVATPAVAGVSAAKVRLKEPPTLPPYPVVTQTIPAFAARQYVLYDVDSHKVIAEKDAKSAVPLASTTKIMTALLTIRNGDLTDVTTVDAAAAAMIGSTAGLRSNERITVRDLLYCALLQSGNDAAFSLANYTGSRAVGDDSQITFTTAIDKFVQLMNQEAKQLGLSSLSFKDPSGLDNSNVGSATDMAKLASIALDNQTFKEFVSTPEITVTSTDGALSHQLKNSNRLVGEWGYPGAIGVKTGFTPEAGHNLVAAATRDGHTLIAVVFNTFSTTPSASAEVARDILDFGWRAISWR